jgi:hypothetical protein
MPMVAPTSAATNVAPLSDPAARLLAAVSDYGSLVGLKKLADRDPQRGCYELNVVKVGFRSRLSGP